MADRLQFQKKLAGLVKLCNDNGRITDTETVETYFAGDCLTEEQTELVYDFLLSQKIIVKGYVKKGGTVKAAGAESEEAALSAEEQRYLDNYEEELQTLPHEDKMYGYLTKVVELAKELYRPEIFIGDLVQEGNVGVMMALENQDASEQEILQMARQCMEALLEEQNEVKVQDRKMVERVQNLDSQIEKLADEMGRKVGVDELAEFSELSEEEIADILKLAGEELPDGEEEEK